MLARRMFPGRSGAGAMWTCSVEVDVMCYVGVLMPLCGLGGVELEVGGESDGVAAASAEQVIAVPRAAAEAIKGFAVLGHAGPR